MADILEMGGDAAAELQEMGAETQVDNMVDEIILALDGHEMPMGGDAAQEMEQAEMDSEEREPPLTEEEILSIITTELTNSDDYNDTISENRNEALAYYLGNPRGDEEAGRSQIISTDVADAIEWILPQIIKSLVSKGPVITFDPIDDNDEEQADLETEFTHDVFMKENTGFLNLYEFVKDALMQKNGIFKILYDTNEDTTTETYTALAKEEVEMLVSQPHIEPIGMSEYPDQDAIQARQQQAEQLQMQLQQAQQQSHQMMQQAQAQPPQDPQQMQQMQQGMAQSQQQVQGMQQQLQQLQQMPPPTLIDIKVKVTRMRGRVDIGCIAPEKFRINQFHDSLDVSDARFTAHVETKSRSDLIEEGYDYDTIMDAGDNLDDNDASERFYEQGEQGVNSSNYTEDRSQELLTVSECYIKMDIEKSGVAELYQVVVLGSEDATDILSIEPVEENPFISSTSIIMSHQFNGLSIYDRLKQLQDNKTSLWRNIMDNLYLQNNREKEVVIGQVNLDDMLVSRPGAIKRVKAPGMIRELQVQPIGQEGYQMMEYLDQVRTGRVGVSPDTMGQTASLGSNIGSQGVDQLLTAKEELTGLMVRVIAETGMKPVYTRIRDLLIRNQNSCTKFKYGDEWVDVNPSLWGRRSRTTVQVGTGTGDDAIKQAAISPMLMFQEKIALAAPDQTLVDEPQIYAALRELGRVSGINDVSEFFLDPSSQAGQQKKQQAEQQQQQNQQKQDELNKQMAQAQAQLAQAEMMKGQAALESQRARLIVDQAKQQSANVEAAMKLELDQAKALADTYKSGSELKFDYDKLSKDVMLKMTEMDLKYGVEDDKLQLQANQQNREETTEDRDNG